MADYEIAVQYRDEISRICDAMKEIQLIKLGGEELNYSAADEEYSMAGTRDKFVRMVRREDRECKESTGSSLIFKRGADNLAMKGTEGTRTQTKTVSCTELPPAN